MRTRLEIFRNGSWIPLLLPTNQKIKYNAVINKIGKVSSRELSHTNTFSIPKVWQNIQALGLNKFNPNTLTTPLNSKYEANYYVEDKLLQSGFIVVNNMPANQIKLNFISGGLRLVDLWSSTTFLKLLTDPNIERPTDYQTNIDEISSYDMTLEPMVKTNDVGSRGYKLCSFPNNLNQLGDDFQKNTNDVRVADSFIPRQSRPTFGAMALFDLAIESFGYTSIYDESVDWGVVEKTYMTSKQASEGKEAKDASAEIVYATIPAGDNHHVNCRTVEVVGIGDFQYKVFQYFKRTAMRFQNSTSTRPIQVPGFNPQHPRFGGPQNGLPVEFQRNDPNKYLNYNTIFQPFVVNGNTGTIKISANLDAASGVELYEYTDGDRAQVIAIWYNQNPASGTIETTIPQTIITQNGQGFDIEINKAFIDSPPTGSDGFAGIMVLLSSGYREEVYQFQNEDFQDRYARIDNMATAETYLLAGEVVFDDDGSYGSSTVDLTYAAHQDTVKDLLMGVMNKEGILMSINDTDKTVKLFSYGHYEAQKESGNFYDWTEYLQKYDVITRDTNYGKEFGRVNQISLTKPYSGNVYNFNLSNHEDGSSKYKDFAKNEVKQFDDVSKVIDIANPTTPYFEYELIEKGLVEQVSDLGDLNQINFANSSQGTISGLTAFANVNYLTIPRGISEWYNLIDRALRIEAKFLLPISLIKTLDISKPVYISDLGGYYIIEEVSEYVDAITPVKIKLIKLVDNLRQYEIINPPEDVNYTDITYTGDNLNINDLGLVGTKTGMCISPNGDFILVISANDDKIQKINLSTNYDLSSATFSNETLDVSSFEGLPQEIAISEDGLNVFFSGQSSDKLRKLVLPTYGDIANGVISSGEINSSVLQSPNSFAISPDGTSVIIASSNIQRIQQYTLSTAFDLGTATLDYDLTDFNYGSGCRYVQFLDDGKTLISLNASSELRQFDLQTAYSLDGLGASSVPLHQSTLTELFSIRSLVFYGTYNLKAFGLGRFGGTTPDKASIIQYEVNLT